VADPNRAHFESVVRLLAPMLDELVFVGGCTTGLFITDPAAGGIRPTKDVDAIVDVTSYAKYTALAEQPRALGLSEDTTPGAPLCRWRHGHQIIDVMPTDATVLGFSLRLWVTSPLRRTTCAHTLASRSWRCSKIRTSPRRLLVSSSRIRPVRRAARSSKVGFTRCPFPEQTSCVTRHACPSGRSN